MKVMGKEQKGGNQANYNSPSTHTALTLDQVLS